MEHGFVWVHIFLVKSFNEIQVGAQGHIEEIQRKKIK